MQQHKRPVLFWDFHGTLTLPDVTWFDAAMEAAVETVPQKPLDRDLLMKNLGGTCLPWFTVPGRDTRHLAGSEKWWAHSEANFARMFMKCGFTSEQAAAMAPLIRPKILQPGRYTLYPDAVFTLQALNRRGCKSYILSNNFPELALLMQPLGLAGLFEEVFVSGEIGYDKPRREIFQHALRRAGAAEEYWMIGDNPEDDIAGGRAAGLKTAAVHNVPAPGADVRVDSLAELLEVFS